MNTKGGRVTVQLTSCLTGLNESVIQIETKIVSCHTADSKPVKQEVNGTVIFPPLVFTAWEISLNQPITQTSYKNRLINGMHHFQCFALLVLLVAAAKPHFKKKVLVAGTKLVCMAGRLTRQLGLCFLLSSKQLFTKLFTFSTSTLPRYLLPINIITLCI